MCSSEGGVGPKGRNGRSANFTEDEHGNLVSDDRPLPYRRTGSTPTAIIEEGGDVNPQLVRMAKALGPWASTFLKDVWPFIRDKRNWERLEDLFRRLSVVLRAKTRAGRLSKFRELLDHACEKATTPEEKEKVESFRRRVDRLQLALEGVDFGDRKARQQVRKAWDTRFGALMSDFMHEFFDWDEEGEPRDPPPRPALGSE